MSTLFPSHLSLAPTPEMVETAIHMAHFASMSGRNEEAFSYFMIALTYSLTIYGGQAPETYNSYDSLKRWIFAEVEAEEAEAGKKADAVTQGRRRLKVLQELDVVKRYIDSVPAKKVKKTYKAGEVQLCGS